MKKRFVLLTLAFLLLASAVAYDYYKRRTFSEKTLASQVSVNLSRETESLIKDSQLILNESKWMNVVHPFFLVDSARFVKWNSTEYPVSVQELSGDFQWKLIHVSRSELLAFKSKINESRFLVGIIPLHQGYELSNRFLSPQWNKRIFPIDGIKITDVSQTDGEFVLLRNSNLFKIQIPSDPFISNPTSGILLLGSLIVFLIFIFIVVKRLHQQRKYLTSFALLVGFLSVIRIVMVQYSVPSRWIYTELFDPRFFASSSFNASAGDFFLNALIVFILCTYLFGCYSKTDVVKQLKLKGYKYGLILGSVLIGAAYFSFLFPQLFIESIFHDSIISFDVTSDVNFTSLRVTVLLALALGGLSSFFFVHIFVRTAKLVLPHNQFFISLGLGALLFLAYFLFSELDYWATLIVGTLYFLFLGYSNYFRSLSSIGYRTFPVIVVAIVLYATQGAYAIWRFVEEKKVKSMFTSASNLFTNDVLGEYLLHQASEKIAQDMFVSSSVENPLLSKNEPRQKIKQLYLSDYFNRYEVNINFYRSDGSPADGESTTDFATTIKTVQDDAFKTTYEGIYLIQNENSEVLKRYLSIISLEQATSAIGYVIIDLSVKHISQQQVYPSLLVDSRFSQSLRNKEFSYASYNKDVLVDHFGAFNFERDFDLHLFEDPRLYSKGIEQDRHWLIAQENETGNRIVLVSNAYPIFNIIANFSFLFSVGILLVGLTLILFFVRFSIEGKTFNYSARIQVFTYSGFIIPLVAVSAIAIKMINQSNESKYEEEIQEKGQKITESLGTIMSINQVHASELKNKLLDLSETLGAEMNLFNSKGELIASSQPAIFRSQLAMPMINSMAWERINEKKFYYLNVPCQIGQLSYNSSFFAIKSKKTGNLLGILELPFFEPTSDSLKANVFSNVVVTFTSVFILFSFVSILALDKLTAPLRFIAKKLKATFLTNNKPIEWSTNDEIGLLVKEYNRMLDNLEQSKTELARREKENAWREIAQQVAHEIKNPLTPMKLTLQQLEYLIANGNLTKDKTNQSIQTLLSQVETLNQIATAFSSFATMPAPELVKVDVVDLLKTTSALFQNNSQGDLYFHSEESSIEVLGDQKLLGRIFSNIILNGLQSGEKNAKVRIDISVKIKNGESLVTIADNGIGIPPELSDKIFLPHFSTKQTGSGLGLAIAKQGIGQMGGEIWFETSDKGTRFYIRLNLA
ncbi:MAG: ATP-binding protein [Cyclobacteriaceae bacterium]